MASKFLLALLALLVLLNFWVRFMLVYGTSMAPSITEADIIIVSRQRPASLQPGDIIAYSHEVGGLNYTFTHRIISIDNGTMWTKGDSLPVPDPYPVRAADVQGVYLGKITGLGLLPKFAVTPQGYLLLIFLPAAIIIWRWLLR